MGRRMGVLASRGILSEGLESTDIAVKSEIIMCYRNARLDSNILV